MFGEGEASDSIDYKWLRFLIGNESLEDVVDNGWLINHEKLKTWHESVVYVFVSKYCLILSET